MSAESFVKLYNGLIYISIIYIYAKYIFKYIFFREITEIKNFEFFKMILTITM
jgi:hypothetical protein